MSGYYLENVQVHRSVAQNIDRMFFSPGAMLNLEYGDLYRSLFNRAERHLAIVEALAQKPKGLGRRELLAAAGLSDGGQPQPRSTNWSNPALLGVISRLEKPKETLCTN